MRSLHWRLLPAELPRWSQPCRACGHRELAPTTRFRVNSNRASHDVWLLYECVRCGAPSKRSLLRRVREHGPSLARYRANDADAAALWALQLGRGARVPWQVVGPLSEGPGDFHVHIEQPYPCRVRADQLIARTLGCSRSRVRSAWGSGVVPIEPKSAPRDIVPATSEWALRVDEEGRLTVPVPGRS